MTQSQKPTPSSLADRAAAMATQAAAVAGPLLAQAREKAGPMLQQARENAGPMLQQARENAQPIIEQARQNAGPMLDQARVTLSHGVEVVAENVDRLTGGKYSDRINAVSSKVGQKLDKPPRGSGPTVHPQPPA